VALSRAKKIPGARSVQSQQIKTAGCLSDNVRGLGDLLIRRVLILTASDQDVCGPSTVAQPPARPILAFGPPLGFSSFLFPASRTFRMNQ